MQKKHSAESLENSPRTRRNSTGRAELGKTEELHRDKLRRRAQLQAPAAKQPRRPTTTLDARLAFWKRRQNSESTGGRGYAEGHGEETARCEGGARRRTADNAIPIAARKNTELENNANKWNAPRRNETSCKPKPLKRTRKCQRCGPKHQQRHAHKKGRHLPHTTTSNKLPKEMAAAEESLKEVKRQSSRQLN